MLSISIYGHVFADDTETTITIFEGSGLSQDCVVDSCYNPNITTVKINEKIIMTNTDTATHTFTSSILDDSGYITGYVFNSNLLQSTQSFKWVAYPVGEFSYHCILHPWMQGVIVVEEYTAITHKSEYYVDDDIVINGTITEIDWKEDTTITYDVISTMSYVILGSGQSDSLQEDGTFQFTISAEDRALWVEHSEDVIFIITIQDHSQEYSFYSSTKPDMSN